MYFYYYTSYSRFFMHLIISIFMALNVDKIYNFCQRYTDEFSRVTNYIIKNYSIQNFRYWKRIVNLFLCFYASILLLFIEITNWMLFITILHHAICSLITEQFEQNNVQYWIEEYKNKPVVKSKQDNILINSYMSEKTVKKRNLNIPIPPKNIITNEDYRQNMYDSITNDDKKSMKLCKSNFF